MRLSSSSAEEFLGLKKGKKKGVGSSCGWWGRCFCFSEETGLVDEFQDLRKHMIVCLFIYICSRTKRYFHTLYEWK